MPPMEGFEGGCMGRTLYGERDWAWIMVQISSGRRRWMGRRRAAMVAVELGNKLDESLAESWILSDVGVQESFYVSGLARLGSS